LVRRDFWRCFSMWWLAVALPFVLAGWWLWERPLLWFLAFWWMRPAGSRLVLFEIGRRLFGERPRWRDSLREIPRAWTRRFFHRFLLGRLSPWLPVTLAVEGLEGMGGKAHRQRCKQIARRGENTVLWIYLITDLATCWFGLAILFLAAIFIPEGQDGVWQTAVQSWDPARPFEIPPLILRVVLACMALAMSLTDIFVTGAGFGIYLNNRTWLEGWDVELALKRMAKRIGGTVVILLIGMICIMPARSLAADKEQSARLIREVKEDPAFEVHKVTDRIPVAKEGDTSWNLPTLKGFGVFLLWTLGAAVAGLLIWLLWINRGVLKRRGYPDGTIGKKSSVRVVMGMEVSPESLPDDVAAAVLALWHNGHHREALGLLYRAAISRLLQSGRVEIRESDTEGNCLRRVETAGAAAHPEYFREVTSAWTRLAYAGEIPVDLEIDALCAGWPFDERRMA
jgi:hypothetical protein